MTADTMTAEESLILNFEVALELPRPAIDWLIGLWRFIQTMDDIADNDLDLSIPGNRTRLNEAIFYGIGGGGVNPFYEEHKASLFPMCISLVMKWIASDEVERNGEADARSYMWRAGYYDVVAQVVAVVHGPMSDKTLPALQLYGEGLSEYLKEFG